MYMYELDASKSEGDRSDNEEFKDEEHLDNIMKFNIVKRS